METLSWRAVSFRIVLSVGIIGSAAACTDQHNESSLPTPTTWELPIPIPVDTDQTCPEPTPADIYATTAAFSEPENPELSDRQPDETYQQHHFRVRSEAAERYGLTVFDYESTLSPLRNDLAKIRDAEYRQAHPTAGIEEDDGNRLTIDEYLKVTQDFLKLYGVELVVAMTGQKLTEDGVGYTSTQELDNTYSKNALITLIESIGELPVELIKYVDLQQIVLLKDIDDKVAGFVKPVTHPHKIFMKPDPNLPYNTLRHEFYHLLDVLECGPYDAQFDTKFTDLNPLDIYAERQGVYTSREGTFETRITLSDSIRSAQLVGDVALQDQFTAQLKEVKSRIVTPSEYGLTTEQEDKAEIGADVLSPLNLPSVLSPESPFLRKKALYLLARLWQRFSGAVEYLSEISSRPHVSTDN